jgi:hypothetical protein
LENFQRYQRHKLPGIQVSQVELERLRALLDTVPGPTPWQVNTLLTPSRAKEKNLRWRKSGNQVVLGEGEDGPAYLALGSYCYAVPVDTDKLLLWYQLMTNHPLSFQNAKIHLLDIESLQPLDIIPDLETRRTRGESPVEFHAGSLAEVEILVSWAKGKHVVRFPEELQLVHELLLLIEIEAKGHGLLGHFGPKNERALCVLKPRDNTIEVFPLDWWNKGNFDFGYEWITKVARDPMTGNIVGEGIRILPFLMDQSCKFLGWIES